MAHKMGRSALVRGLLRSPAMELDAHPPTVLLVDDNVETTRALSLLLEQSGFAVVTAHDGGEALRRARETRPRIALLDLGLPVVDGYRVAQTLRGWPGGDGLLLVAISGYGQPEDCARALDVGFDHHLVKPIDCTELLALLSVHKTPM